MQRLIRHTAGLAGLGLGAALLALALGGSPALAWHGPLVGIGIYPPAVVVAPPTVYAPPPPVYAPAPVTYYYQYYPDQQVYFDASRGLYFWMGYGGRWQWGPALPPHLVLGPRRVMLPMEYARPYRHHQDVYRHHPPAGSRPW
jgi:hypothetical protein